jgi:mono/diheme cytochrome c family protein
LQIETRRRWPGGLAIGNPDLPNRNPLSGLTTWPADRAARIAHSHVAARFDPLAPRLPREIWQIDAPGALGSLISSLAEFVSATDRQHLENALTRQTGSATTRLISPCRIYSKSTTSRWSLQCAPHPGAIGPTLSGDLSIVAGRPGGGRLSRIQLPAGTAINNVELQISGQPRALGTSFTPRLNQRLARTAEGHAISRLRFQYNASDLTTGHVDIEIREEFTAIEEAITALLNTALGKTLFGSGVFPRTELLAAVLAQLGAAALPPCCQAAKNLPAPRLETPAVIPGSSATAPAELGQQAFYPYCATCHQTAETFPPNFLTGSNNQVASQLRHCAARLYVRLAMSDIPLEHRDKTPMPPESMLPAFASDIANWRSSPTRAALLAQVSGWLRAESGQPPNLTQLLAGGYEALRPCLPVEASAERRAAP